MKLLLVLASLWWVIGAASGAPYLVSDPYIPNADPNLNPVSFVISGIGTATISVPATTLTGGNIILQYDLASLANGKYSVTAAAVNVFGGESPFSSPPFVFTKGVPATPTNLRISQLLLH